MAFSKPFLIYFLLVSSYYAVSASQQNFKTFLTEEELIELDDPSTFAKNVAMTSGAVVATGLGAACAFFFLTPPGLVACAGAAIVGLGTAVVAPNYVAPDVRVAKCSPEQYRDRLKWLMDRNLDNKDCSKLSGAIDTYCSKQCIYPTNISPIGGNRCSNNNKIKSSVVREYNQVVRDLNCKISEYKYDIEY